MLLFAIGILSDTYNFGVHMRRECRERFPHHRLHRKPLFSDPNMHHVRGETFPAFPAHAQPANGVIETEKNSKLCSLFSYLWFVSHLLNKSRHLCHCRPEAPKFIGIPLQKSLRFCARPQWNPSETIVDMRCRWLWIGSPGGKVNRLQYNCYIPTLIFTKGRKYNL